MKFAALVLAAAIAAPAAAVTYDPHVDYTNAANPNGVYSYGFENVLGGPLTLFTSGGAANGSPASWTSPGVDQYLGVYNLSSSILQHPGPAGQYSILRITVASGGSYSVGGTFSNGDNATTDVHVLFNGVSAFDSAVSGSLTPTFAFTQYFAAGSTIDFAVGNGGNGYNNDSTLLSALVSSVPEPATWGLMIAGFGMVGFAARRRSAAVTA